MILQYSKNSSTFQRAFKIQNVRSVKLHHTIFSALLTLPHSFLIHVKVQIERSRVEIFELESNFYNQDIKGH